MSIQDYNSPEAIMSKVPLPATDCSDIRKLRDQNDSSEKAAYESAPSFGVEDRVVLIPTRDGHQSSTRIFRSPGAPSKGSPLIVLIYGGGFILGSNLQLASLARIIAATHGATVVALSYRLAPEHPFPIPGNDIRDGLEWVTENAESIGADPSAGFIVCGGSAGGNLAVTSTHMATVNPLRQKITGLWLIFPILMSEKHSPVLRSPDLDIINSLYAPDEDSPERSPDNMSDSFSSSKLPRTFIQVAGLDPLRDDGLMYARTLEDHNVDMKLKVYPGYPHGFIALPDLEASIQFVADANEALGWMLGVTGRSGQ
ncbi:hypothetical protein FOXG_14405 [Fusarium oxysporum f. sp. lycopersici 4287]|uniref:Alpha/beta hydrolase fold-3 domain-containing protein n=1 Tax=Fusarium oxysporum f. sp. lycopersici (strain 4287 / CBS 123668 / FGSC 9935 / NRRL 34936) TaxID=426428 RepID=A0A0J9W0L1_FUSO4|nr:hypothetical protein FOXG_14405 [Fusarium oxysporum f. sp. lycopersici 4287]KNB16578.1 hypothetical protein FOXG_14405 [Fusarium oxysporum f. sp. lycopersici 4287]